MFNVQHSILLTLRGQIVIQDLQGNCFPLFLNMKKQHLLDGIQIYELLMFNIASLLLESLYIATTSELATQEVQSSKFKA